ncbi:precorrin-8X methylmutase [Catenulispora yoronensis]|uniref:Precorrin-8X methylmutase n=1 Tax=Catenulispora yoronensis TaxID=450799 RepID=A0ABN2UXW9_9ACTN
MTARTVHPIEAESYRILRSQYDTASLPPYTRAVTERVIHASADFDYASDLVLADEAVLARAAAALAAGAPIVADVEMVAAGITRRKPFCGIRDPAAPALAAERGITRSAAGLVLAAEQAGPDAVYVIGCAPTALFELIDVAAEVRPALVIGLPVGFVGAAESKAALRESGLPAVSNVSGKGGSAVAAAALNALLYEDLVSEASVKEGNSR